MVISPTLPPAIAHFVGDADLQAAATGLSGAEVFHVASDPARYLKITAASAYNSSLAEYRRLTWLGERVPVAPVTAYAETETHQYLLTEEISGTMAYDESLAWSDVDRLRYLAAAAQQFHALPIDDCPFDWRLETQLARAKANVANNAIHTAQFTPDLRHRTPDSVLAEALTLRPHEEDIVVVHGDLYPVNVLLKCGDGSVSAYLDVGRCGVGDCYTDLALIANTIGWHLDAALVPKFFQFYGIQTIDERKLRFYQLLRVLL